MIRRVINSIPTGTIIFIAGPDVARRPMVRRIAQDRGALSNLAVVVLLLVAVGLITAVWVSFFVPRPGPEPLVAQDGDRVSVNYIGYFQDTNLVFDTSLESVAEDNATWRKAVSFTFRGTWQTYGFRLGDPADPQRPVPGFEDGIRRMAEGDTREIPVPPDVGYGPMDLAKLVVRPILESVPVRLTMNTTEFQVRYSSPPVSGANVTDPLWGWPALVDVAGSVITVTNSPKIRQVVRPFDAWNAEVVEIDDTANVGDGTILVRHDVKTSMLDAVGGTSNGQDFYLSDVNIPEDDPDTGTYTLNFNRQVVGRTLVFQVTLVTLLRL